MSTRNLVLASLVAVTLAAASLPSLAQTPAPEKKTQQKKMTKEESRRAYEAKFKAADKNGDGGLSKDELKQTKGFNVIRNNFDAMDTNNDGKVTPEEHRAWRKAHRAQKKK